MKFKCFNINKNNKKIKKNTWRYHYFISVHQQTSWYDLQFLRYRVWQTEIGKYGSFFPLPPKSQKNQNFEKMKNIAGDIIILYKCTKNHNHMRYSSCEIWSETDRIFCHFGLFFALLPPNSPKSAKNHDHMLYCFQDMAHDRCTVEPAQMTTSIRWPLV